VSDGEADALVQAQSGGVPGGDFERRGDLIGLLKSAESPMEEDGSEPHPSVPRRDADVLQAPHSERIKDPLDGSTWLRRLPGAGFSDQQPSGLRREVTSVNDVAHELQATLGISQTSKDQGVKFVGEAGPFGGRM
jgi:hypothetical protein